MSDSPWNLYLARLRRIQPRFSALFWAVAVVIVYLSTNGAGEETIGYGLLAVAILLLSVLAHEAGHCLAAIHTGGSPEQVTIGPLGGLSFPSLPREPQAEFFTSLAGPVVNLAIMLLVLPAILVARLELINLLSPLRPVGLLDGAWWAVALKLTFWFNWVMLLVNMLPAFPFDGARVLRDLLWPALDYRGATVVAVRTTKLTAVGACVLAWLVSDVQSAAHLPAWVPLLLFAVFVFHSGSAEAARLEEADWEEELFSYDFSQGYTSLERAIDPPRKPAGSPVRRWLENRREIRRRKRRFQEQEEERQVDQILVRLHESGLDGLTAKERALLNRVSARYRNRQGS